MNYLLLVVFMSFLGIGVFVGCSTYIAQLSYLLYLAGGYVGVQWLGWSIG